MTAMRGYLNYGQVTEEYLLTLKDLVFDWAADIEREAEAV